MSSADQIFNEEANELIEIIEANLITLETSEDKSQSIEAVFRAMHTLKGNCGMFGLDNVADFLHNLETVYDWLRDNKLTADKNLIDTSLLALDHLKKFILDPNLTNPSLLDKNQEVSEKVKAILGFEESISSQKPASQEVPVQEEEADSTEKAYYLKVIPGEEVSQNGTQLLALVNELREMGQTRIFPKFSTIKKIKDFNPLQNYSAWEILLYSKNDINSIKDVFVFIEDESTIQIELLGNHSPFGSPEFDEWIAGNLLILQDQYCDTEILKAEYLKILQNNPVIEEKPTKTPEFSKPIEPVVPEKQSDTVKKPETDNRLGREISSIRVSSDKLDGLLNIVSELVTTQASLSLYTNNHHTTELETISENVEKLSRQLRDVAFGMTLIPLRGIINRFKRLIRDTSNELGKEVDFQIYGDDTELDKNIMERLTDPLMHILRNSIDHGIESADERARAGKPETGTIIFKAFYSGANVHIQVKDDGKGLDEEKIRNKAISKGLISSTDSISRNDLFNLIFEPGFSTATKVTGVSGRGVGLDVVNKNISYLRGEIDIDSEKGIGTTFTIKLPLTLSIIDGLLVQIDNENFIIQLSAIKKVYEVPYSKLKNRFNHIIVLDDLQIPYINLRNEFDKLSQEDPQYSSVIVVHNNEAEIGISVDMILGEYQAVLKPIGKYYRNQEFVSGATILGDGTVALVLDTDKLIELKTRKKTAIA